MPIKPENKCLYPDNWKEIREYICERAKDRCENCGAVNHSWINRITREICISDEYNAIRIVCTTAHLDHDPENSDEQNLRFWCQKCHNNYDRSHRNQSIKNNKLKGQLILF